MDDLEIAQMEKMLYGYRHGRSPAPRLVIEPLMKAQLRNNQPSFNDINYVPIKVDPAGTV